MKTRAVRSLLALVSLSGGALLALTPAGAIAKPPTDKAAIDAIAAVRKALGLNRMAKGTSLQAQGSSSFLGKPGTVTLLFDNEGRFVQTQQSMLSTTSGYDGNQAWTTDFSGETQIAELADRAGATLPAWFMTGHWTATPDDFNISAVSSAGDVVTFVFTYDNDRLSGSVEVKASTNLPTQLKFVSGTSTQTVSIESWTDYEGMKFPCKLSVATTNGYGNSLTFDKVGPAPIFIRSPFEPLLGMATGAKFDPSATPALEVKRAPTRHLLVRPMVNGQDLGAFIFDTGAGRTVLDHAAAQKLGLEEVGEVPAVGVGGAVPAKLYRARSISLGAMTMDAPVVVGLDLGFLAAPMGEAIGGIIGYDMLARCIAEVDPDGTVSLHDPATFKGDDLPWQKLTLYGRIPCMEASFEGHTGIFKLDTGAAGDTVTFHGPTVARLKLLEGRETQDSQAGGVGGVRQVKRGNIAWFELAGRRTENVRATFFTETGGAFSDSYTAGNIGGQLLKPFHLVFDYPHSRIALVAKKEASGEPKNAGPK